MLDSATWTEWIYSKAELAHSVRYRGRRSSTAGTVHFRAPGSPGAVEKHAEPPNFARRVLNFGNYGVMVFLGATHRPGRWIVVDHRHQRDEGKGLHDSLSGNIPPRSSV